MAGIYIHQDLALSIVMDWRTPTAIQSRAKLRLNQHDLINDQRTISVDKNNESISKRRNISTAFYFKLQN